MCNLKTNSKRKHKKSYKGKFMFKVIAFLMSLFGHKCASGSIFLVPSGDREIVIKPGFSPKEVWIRPMDNNHMTVCMAEFDCFDTKVIPHGFVLIANLKSEYREIQWIAIK